MQIQYRRVAFIQSIIFPATVAVAMLVPYAHAQNRELPIWPGGAPGSETWTQKEIHSPESTANNWKTVRNVVIPTITVFQPEKSKANGTGIIICPGGGYEVLNWESEGTLLAQWLTERGVTAFVLKYRLMRVPADPKGTSNDPASTRSNADDELAVFQLAVMDGVQAVKFVRQRAAEFGVSSDRIGTMGFSAGGDVAMGTAIDYDASSRPNFAAMIYGGFTRSTSPPADAPPIFLAVAQDDAHGFAKAGEEISSWWRRAHHSAELHIYATGGHGFGMGQQGLPIDHWVDRFSDWLDWQGLLTKKP